MMALHRPFLLTAILAVITSGSVAAQTQVVPYNHLPSGNHGVKVTPWMVHATNHFDIYYERQHQRALDEIARNAERAYARVSFDLQHELAARMPLIVVHTDREMPQNPGQARELVRASGAPDGDHLLLAVEPSSGRSASLVHELTHQFAFELIPLSSGVPAVDPRSAVGLRGRHLDAAGPRTDARSGGARRGAYDRRRRAVGSTVGTCGVRLCRLPVWNAGDSAISGRAPSQLVAVRFSARRVRDHRERLRSCFPDVRQNAIQQSLKNSVSIGARGAALIMWF
jgi:hypothetical protein